MPRFAILLAALALTALADDRNYADDKPALTDRAIEKIAAAARQSIAVVTVTGRDGKREGLGTGFVVSADGLIATNLHVIGEARPISVQLDGKTHEVTHVHATDRAADLAVLRIAAKDLTPLELGDATKTPQGATVIALGNPLGLERSVVAGVISGRREIDGRSMIQLAMPVERGNSGGPVADLQGKVLGIVTMKSAVTENLGFAVPVNSLRPLLDKPNPVAIGRWLTIGALDGDDWQVLFGARWRQRAGRITVDGTGNGFGGRSLCLSKRPTPELPFEMAVTVRLDNENGAAGLAFHADGNHKHYGFYATGGGLRLTRFDGADVFSWKILEQLKTHPHYHAGAWNTLKVRIEKDKLRCFINDQPVFESTDDAFTSGQIGLVKFRDTAAEFKAYRVGKKLETVDAPPEVTAKLTKDIAALAPADVTKPQVVDKLAPQAPAAMTLLRERARELERQAEQLRKLAGAVHAQRVHADLVKALAGKEADVDLVHAALLVARLDNDELDVDAYRAEFDRLARKLASELPKDADAKVKTAALNRFLFTERGFHGSRGDYYNKSNSYLNEVIDDREGLPITLAVLYIELGRKIGLPLEGVPLPGHFTVRLAGAEDMIDVFDGGAPLSKADAEKKVRDTAGRAVSKDDLTAAPKRAIIVRMIRNLLGIARNERDGETMLRYLDAILALTPASADDRWLRAQLRYHAGRKDGALEDATWLLDNPSVGIDRDDLLQFRRLLRGEE